MSQPTADDHWDAGEMGCGELILKLKVRVKRLPPAGVLHLRALDAGARADLPAWCRLTGHPLVQEEHPNYWIQRKQEL